MATAEAKNGWLLGLRIGALIVALLIAGVAYLVFAPVFAVTAEPPAEQKVKVPVYDYAPWRSLAVEQGGRRKPFETAAREIVRQICGREKFQGQDPVALVLMWSMLEGTSEDNRFLNWETYPFILCDNHELRKVIYAHRPDEATLAPAERENLLHGKYVSPADLRSSPEFLKLVDETEDIHNKYRDSDVNKIMTPLQRKAEEVAGRLVRFDGVSQNSPIIQGTRRTKMQLDPIGVVALDKVPGAAWFSIGSLRAIQENSQIWQKIMRDRLAQEPQRYVSPERVHDLQHFQEQIRAGRGKADNALKELEQALSERREESIQAFESRHKDGALVQGSDLIRDEVFSGMNQEDQARLGNWIHANNEAKEKQGGEITVSVKGLAGELRGILRDRDQKLVAQLQNRVQYALTVGYHPDDIRFRMLHLDYLESRYPNLYLESAAWQAAPRAQIDRVLMSFTRLKEAYRSENSSLFAEATQNYFTTLAETSGGFDSYPGVSTIGLEMQFNRIQPFMWGWIIMLGAVLSFIVSMALNSRRLYLLAFVCYFASLAFQVFGFFVRVYISGRPPVSNMYETVIWVSFMSCIFALVLELVYRRKIIGLAGAAAATLGLILADYLPLPGTEISPLVPVLRSNYWLTVHVLTIVSSYAGGTLAWALGNIALGLLAFGKGSRETLKNLSQFTYRAIQIAVLLLAAGTFLGGWWAAESWGRFWGWDPKEVWALIALVCYVIPLHARYVGWVKEFGLAIAAVICYAAIVMSWYGVNFVLGIGLHSYGFGGGGYWWVLWFTLINIEWVLITSMLYLSKQPVPEGTPGASESPGPVNLAPEMRFKPGLGNA